MEYLWTLAVGVLAVLLALLIDSYVGVSGWLAKKPSAVAAAV